MSALVALALIPSVAPAGPARTAHLGLATAVSAHLPGHGGSPSSGTDPGGRLSEADVTDTVTGSQTHAIYFVPKDRTDEGLDAAGGGIARAIDGVRAWFEDRMGKRPRWDREPTGVYDISFVRGEYNASYYNGLGPISDELIRRGFDDESKRYVVFATVNLGNTCGAGYFPTVPQIMRQFHAVYLDSMDCDARDWGGGTASTAGKTGTIMVQEWLHNEGLASPGTPHHCAAYPFHVCTGPLVVQPELDPEEPDALFPIVTGKLSRKQLDIGNDDYLDHPWPHVPDLRDSTWLE